MREPMILLNWPAIITAVIAAFIVGFLWYGPLFSKPWAKEMKMKMDKRPDPKVMTRALLLQLLGLFLTTFVLAHFQQSWRPSIWGLDGDGPNSNYGFFAGFFAWIGFYVPMQFGKVSWEGRSWKLFAINAGHDFVVLQVISQILAHWR